MGTTSKHPAPIKLETPGERGFVDSAKAKEIIQHWNDQLAGHLQIAKVALGADADLSTIILCDRISLTDKSYDAEAASLIAEFLSTPWKDGLPPLANGIVEADLSDIIAGRMTEEGLQVLETICDAFRAAQLVEADLSDNAIGQQGIGACKSVIGKKSLERLSLCNNGLSEATMAQVADILTNDEDGTGSIASRLTKIHFYNNMSGEGGCSEFVRILEQSKCLVDIRFSSTRARREGSTIVASALDAALADGRNADLERLDLCDNIFKDAASHDALFRALGATKCLKYLDLRECDLEDDGVKKVCHALFESDSALEHLDLSGNCITRKGAKHIADFIRDCQGKLKILRLEDNEMTSLGVQHIAKAFHVSEDGFAIEEIKLNCNMCGAIGARALIDAFGPGGKDLPNLNKILLDGNSFDESILSELKEAFQDKLGEMEDNDDEGDADDDLSSDEEDDDEDEDDDESEDVHAAEVDADELAAMMEKSSIV